MPFSLRRYQLELILLAILAIVVYFSFRATLANTFVPFDDDIEITSNLHIRHLNADTLHWMFTDTLTTQRYTPFSWIAWAVIYHFYQAAPAPYHAFALFTHIANTLLLFILLRQLLARFFPDAPNPLLAPLLCATFALLWGVHPLGVEVVGWATQVRFAEATLFALVSLIAYLQMAPSPGKLAWRLPLFWIAVGAYTVSILFYANAIMLPLVLVIADIQLLRRFDPAVSFIRSTLTYTFEKIPFFVPAFFVGVMTLLGRIFVATTFAAPETLAGFPLSSRIAQALYILAYYLWKPFWPFHISPVYTTLLDIRPLSMPFVMSYCLLAALVAASILLRKRLPAAGAFLAAYFLMILPVGGYLEHPYYSSDRYGYITNMLLSAALLLLLFQFWNRLFAKVRPLIAGAFGLVILVFALYSPTLFPLWHDSELFLISILERLDADDPFRADIQWRLGNLYREQQRFPEALAQVNQSISRVDTLSKAYEVRASILHDYALQLSGEQRRTLFLDAAKTYDFLFVHFHQQDSAGLAGDNYLSARDLDDAETRFRSYLQLHPRDVRRRYDLAFTEFLEGRLDEARATLQEAAADSHGQIDPDTVLLRWSGKSSSGTP